MYYDHEVGFKSWIEYGMNDFCAHGLTVRHRLRRPDGIIHNTLIVHDFCRT